MKAMETRKLKPPLLADFRSAFWTGNLYLQRALLSQQYDFFTVHMHV